MASGNLGEIAYVYHRHASHSGGVTILLILSLNAIKTRAQARNDRTGLDLNRLVRLQK